MQSWYVLFLDLSLDLSLICWLDTLYGVSYHICGKIFSKMTILILESMFPMFGYSFFPGN